MCRKNAEHATGKWETTLSQLQRRREDGKQNFFELFLSVLKFAHYTARRFETAKKLTKALLLLLLKFTVGF